MSGRGVEWPEDHLLPVNEEPLIITIISVSPDGERVDTGIEFKIAAVPTLIEKLSLIHISLSNELRDDIRKIGNFMVPVSALKKTHEIEKLARRLRGHLQS